MSSTFNPAIYTQKEEEEEEGRGKGGGGKELKNTSERLWVPFDHRICPSLCLLCLLACLHFPLPEHGQHKGRDLTCVVAVIPACRAVSGSQSHSESTGE